MYKRQAHTREYAHRAHRVKELFERHGFHIVYDKDQNEHVSDGFFFTVGYGSMPSSDLVAALLRYGICAISLTSTGSLQNGVRVCVSQMNREEQYDLLRLRDMSDVSRRAMEESHLVSRDLLRSPETAAVLVKRDSSVSIMMNEDDHLRIQAVRTGDDLLSAAQACFCVDDALSRQNEFAFDQQLGYLTAFPTNAGTGMRASLLLHLPLLTRSKQMGNVGQMVAKVGLNIRGVYGEGAEALGNIYQISNQVTLGRTEQELITTVEAVGQRLTMMEQNLEEKALTTAKIETEDAVQRAFGILTHARILPRGEFYQMYSNLRLGATMGLLPLSVQKVDEVLDQAQDAHLCIYAGETLSGQALDAARADRVRELLGE